MKSETRPSPDRTPVRIDAAGAADARVDLPYPVSLLFQPPTLPTRPGTLLALDRPEAVDHHPAAGAATTIRLPQAILLPGLVNAHAHLDLTHVGPRPHDTAAGFTPWIDMVRRARHSDPDQISASVARGIEASLRGGTVLVGDIAGATARGPSDVPADTLSTSPLAGVTFLEFFGIGTREPTWRARVEALGPRLCRSGHNRVSLSPHSPLSVSRALFAVAAELAGDLPLATHLAESPEEAQFLRDGSGPHRTFLEGLGLWSDAILRDLQRSPAGYVREAFDRARFLAVHVNDCANDLVDLLARTGASVAYCPRASAYFGFDASLGPHRYRDLLASGVNVCLGTDSVINLPRADRLSVLDDARLLFRRDAIDPRRLLEMMTVNGARALGFDPAWWTFRAGEALAGVAAVEAGPTLRGVFESESPACAILGLRGLALSVMNTMDMERDGVE